MKTKLRYIPFLAMIFILVPRYASAHDDYSKVIKKEYSINADAQVILENKFGQIHCNNWDKNTVSIEVTVTVTAGSLESANKIFGMVSIAANGTPSQVEARTVFTSESPKGNNRINVDYMVFMPQTVSLNLTNKFGDVFLNTLSGKGNLTVAYGNLEVNKLQNSDNVLDIKFGKANVQYITGAVLSLKYSEMKVVYAGSLFVDAKYSDLSAGKVISLSAGFEGGNLDIDQTSAVTMTSKFSDLNFGNLDKSLNLDIQYGNCDVEKIQDDFSVVSIRNKYGDVTVAIPSETSYILDADLKFCDLDFPEDQANLNQKITTNTSKSFRGNVGRNPSPVARVTIRSEFGNVSLE